MDLHGQGDESEQMKLQYETKCVAFLCHLWLFTRAGYFATGKRLQDGSPPYNYHHLICPAIHDCPVYGRGSSYYAMIRLKRIGHHPGYVGVT